LFGILRKLVVWENTNNETVLEEAREEIWKSCRETCALNKNHPDAATLFNPEKLTAFHDPFAVGESVPFQPGTISSVLSGSLLATTQCTILANHIRRFTR
jgi:putative DNA methylase